MRLTAATDVATFVIFDPGALPETVVDSRDPLDQIDQMTSCGEAICYSFCSDGDTDFLILVDEAPDQEFLDRRFGVVDNILLRVPTGRIVATGYEDLRVKYKREEFTPKMGEAAEIPAGNYLVTAFGVDWGEEPEQEISDRALPGDERFESIVGTSMGCAVLFTIIAIPTVIGNWHRLNMRVAGYILCFYVMYWLIVIPIVLYSKRWRRMQELRNDVYVRHPNNILVFCALTEPISDRQFNAGKFGEGFIAEEA
ncbi:MAG: hypothetical protein HUJ26_23410 [Planctomycetaceae bacterium]|nr:hypothetical protein [Planctomycetaceae bacterium]